MTNLKILRLKKGYTHSLLAQLMQTGTSVIARWELGQTVPTLAQTVKLCTLLSCKAADLFCDEDFFAADGIPLFDCDGRCSSFVPSDCGCSADTAADFAVALSADISDQFKNGDICCFSLLQRPLSHSAVLCTNDGYSSRITLYDNCSENETVLAVCTAVRCMI